MNVIRSLGLRRSIFWKMEDVVVPAIRLRDNFPSTESIWMQYHNWVREYPMNEAGRQLWETMWREANQQ